MLEEQESRKQHNIKIAQDHLQDAAEQMKKQYDAHANPCVFKVGDRVYIKKKHISRGESRKLSPLMPPPTPPARVQEASAWEI